MWLLDVDGTDRMFELTGRAIRLTEDGVLRITDARGYFEFSYTTVEEGRQAVAILRQAIRDGKPFVSLKEQGVPMATYDWDGVWWNVIVHGDPHGDSIPIDVRATVEPGESALNVRMSE